MPRSWIKSGIVAAASYPTLGFELLAAASDTSASDPYTFTGSYQLGNQRLGLAFVTTTDATGNDPAVITSLTGGGASAWTSIATTTQNTAGTVGRRLTCFVARDETTGGAGNLVVDVSGTHTGCVIVVVRTTGATPSSAVALATSSAVTNTGLTAPVTLSPPAAEDAANRQVCGLFSNNETSTYTPEANWSVLTGYTTMVSPSITSMAVVNTTAFDSTPSGDWNSGVRWAGVCVEVEQG